MWSVWKVGEVHAGFWWGKLEEGDTLEDPGIDGRTVLNNFQEVGWGGMDCVCLVQGRVRLQALVNAVMNVRIP